MIESKQMGTGKRKVVLEFPTLKELIDYTLDLDLSNCEIVRTRRLLICELSEADIELAKRGYNALIIE